MFEPCVCGTGGANTGQPSCVPTIKRTAKLVAVRTFANDGTRNSVKASDFVNGVLPDTFIESKINETDVSKRWYVTPKINAVTDVRSEPVPFDVDGIPKIIDQGTRTFTGSFYDKLGAPQFAGVMNSFSCFDISYFEISVEGALVGIDGGAEMFPIAVETGTWNATVVRGTKTELNSVSLSFSVNELVRDENLIQIASSSIESDLLLKRGLIDVNGVALASPVITATTARLDMSFIYGNFNEPIALEDLQVADVTVFNVTQSAAIVVSSITAVVGESGQYDMVVAAGAISADELQVSLTKNGFEMTPFTYLIP